MVDAKTEAEREREEAIKSAYKQYAKSRSVPIDAVEQHRINVLSQTPRLVVPESNVTQQPVPGTSRTGGHPYDGSMGENLDTKIAEVKQGVVRIVEKVMQGITDRYGGYEQIRPGRPKEGSMADRFNKQVEKAIAESETKFQEGSQKIRGASADLMIRAEQAKARGDPVRAVGLHMSSNIGKIVEGAYDQASFFVRPTQMRRVVPTIITLATSRKARQDTIDEGVRRFTADPMGTGMYMVGNLAVDWGISKVGSKIIPTPDKPVTTTIEYGVPASTIEKPGVFSSRGSLVDPIPPRTAGRVVTETMDVVVTKPSMRLTKPSSFGKRGSLIDTPRSIIGYTDELTTKVVDVVGTRPTKGIAPPYKYGQRGSIITPVPRKGFTGTRFVSETVDVADVPRGFSLDDYRVTQAGEVSPQPSGYLDFGKKAGMDAGDMPPKTSGYQGYGKKVRVDTGGESLMLDSALVDPTGVTQIKQWKLVKTEVYGFDPGFKTDIAQAPTVSRVTKTSTMRKPMYNYMGGLDEKVMFDIQTSRSITRRLTVQEPMPGIGMGGLGIETKTFSFTKMAQRGGLDYRFGTISGLRFSGMSYSGMREASDLAERQRSDLGLGLTQRQDQEQIHDPIITLDHDPFIPFPDPTPDPVRIPDPTPPPPDPIRVPRPPRKKIFREQPEPPRTPIPFRYPFMRQEFDQFKPKIRERRKRIGEADPMGLKMWGEARRKPVADPLDLLLGENRKKRRK